MSYKRLSVLFTHISYQILLSRMQWFTMHFIWILCSVDKCILCVISTMLNWLHKSFCQLMLPHPRSFFSIFSWVGELLKLHRIHDKLHVCFSYIRLALPLIHLNLYPATLSFSWLLSNPYITIEIVQGSLSIEIDKMNIKNKE